MIYNASKAKLNYNKYLFLKNTTAFLVVIGIFFSLISFNLQYQKGDICVHTTLFLMITNLFLKFILVITYIVSVHFYGKYLKSIALLGKKENYFKKVGYFPVILRSLILYIQPLFFLRGINSTINEFFWVQDHYELFHRSVNHYLYITQFTIQFWFCFYVILENSEYAQSRAQRITKMYSVQNDIQFVAKCILDQIGIIFSVFLIFFGVFFFATLINVTEIGYSIYLKESDFETAEEYLTAKLSASYVAFYYNTIWYVFITMTSVGYGDMWVNSTFSRILVFFISLYGTIMVPVLILTFTNILEMNRNEQLVMEIVNNLEDKKKL